MQKIDVENPGEWLLTCVGELTSYRHEYSVGNIRVALP